MEMISICGLSCHECGAFLAALNDDEQKRQETAELWSKQYGVEIKPEDINCSGCTQEGVHVSHCGVCEIRACGIEKEVENCAYCPDYICAKLEKFFEMVPSCREQLNGIHAGLK